MVRRTVSAYDARRQFGQLLDDVMINGDEIVVERHGRAIAAIVPMRMVERSERAREEFFRVWNAAAARANMPPDEADELAKEAIRWARAQSR